MSMWQVLETKTVTKSLRKAPVEVLRRYETWKRIVEISGPKGLRLIKGFRDEALQGRWSGYRSSRLGNKWRIIYRIDRDYLEVHIFEINAHKY